VLHRHLSLPRRYKRPLEQYQRSHAYVFVHFCILRGWLIKEKASTQVVEYCFLSAHGAFLAPCMQSVTSSCPLQLWFHLLPTVALFVMMRSGEGSLLPFSGSCGAIRFRRMSPALELRSNRHRSSSSPLYLEHLLEFSASNAGSTLHRYKLQKDLLQGSSLLAR